MQITILRELAPIKQVSITLTHDDVAEILATYASISNVRSDTFRRILEGLRLGVSTDGSR